MSDLFKKTDEISEKFFSNPAFKKRSINDLAMAQVVNMAFLIKNEEREEAQRHLTTVRKLQRKAASLHDAGLILSGQPGFLRCSQGWADIQSGFTTLQEIVLRITEPMVDVSTERMNVSFGMELWAIDERGMMTLIDYKRDSSD